MTTAHPGSLYFWSELQNFERQSFRILNKVIEYLLVIVQFLFLVVGQWSWICTSVPMKAAPSRLYTTTRSWIENQIKRDNNGMATLNHSQWHKALTWGNTLHVQWASQSFSLMRNVHHVWSGKSQSRWGRKKLPTNHIINAWQPVKCNTNVLCISQWWELPHCNHGEGQRDEKTFEKSAEEDVWNSDPRTRALMSEHFALQVRHTQTHNTLLLLLGTHPSGDSMHLRSTAHKWEGGVEGPWRMTVPSHL